jgi:hypothetical protein
MRFFLNTIIYRLILRNARQERVSIDAAFLLED